MEIKTFTNFWNMERKLYSIQDIALPVPIPLTVLAATLGMGIPWAGLMMLLHVPFNNPGYLLWLGPPAALGYLSSRPIFQRKTLLGFMKSMFRYYFMQAKRYGGTRPVKYQSDTEYRFRIRIFTREEKTTRKALKQ